MTPLIGGISTLVVSLMCVVIVVHGLSDPSISLGSIVAIVLAAVGGVVFFALSSVILLSAYQFSSARR